MFEQLAAEFLAFLILGIIFYIIAFVYVKIKEKLNKKRK